MKSTVGHRLTPVEATELLGELGTYSQKLTGRTTGLSLMAWSGLVFALFFVSFALAAGGSSVDPMLGVAVLVALVVAGIGFTNLLWHSRSLGPASGFNPWKIWGQGLLLLIAGNVLMVWIDSELLTETDSSVSLAFVATIVMLYLGIRMVRAPWARTPWMLLAAGAMVVADVALVLWAPASLPAPDGLAHLLAATATSTALAVPGYLYYRQG